MIGTRGVPARYGGFESAVEEIGTRLVQRGHDVTVYCRNEGQSLVEYRGMRLVNLPAVRVRAAETLSHSGLSAAHSILRDRPDMAFVFNPANAPYVRLLRLGGVPTAVNMDGFEWRRAKWAGSGARYFRWAARASAKGADVVIADSRVMQQHVREAYGRDSEYVAYGADVVPHDTARLAELGLASHEYHLVVARFEPENQVREIVAAAVSSSASRPLVVVGSAPYAAEYTRQVREAAADDPRVRFLGAVWDQELLNQLYAGSLSYVHGHSVGGTNPSLLRAMAAGAPVIADDNPFNREVLGEAAEFVSDRHQIASALLADERDGAAARARGAAARDRVHRLYRWDDVAGEYERIALRLVP